jgi:hypothetical protein
MKTLELSKKHRRGQVVPIFIVMLITFIVMIALVIDGGSMMYNKRVAQLAADAGALAGAKEICNNSTETIITNAAISYATINKASSVQTNISNDEITVDTLVENASLFAKIFNANKLQSKATASAACFSPSKGTGTLPIAWSCKAPVTGSDSPDCQVHTLDWDTEMKPLVVGSPNPVSVHNYGSVPTPMDFSNEAILNYIYIIVDSNKVDDDIASTCAPIGSMDCDLNNDGVNEVFGGGDRSWMDLNGGGGGAADMKNWITNGYNGTLSIHTWLAGQSGVETSVYNTVQDVINRYPPTYPVVLVPVFNGICDQNPNGKPICESNLHNPIPPEEKVIPSGGTQTTYFHIAGFSALYLTCVDSGGENKCPGAKAFLSANKKNPDVPKKIKSIEGYFISNYPFDLGSPGSGGVDVGIHIVSLTK